MNRAYPTVIGLALACAVTGCSGGDPEPTPTPTPTATRWQRGEITASPGLCGAIPRGLTARLNLEAQITGGDYCTFVAADDDAPVQHSLTIQTQLFAPPAARPDHTATEEARHEFIRPPGWRAQDGTPLPGYGDQAKLDRTIDTDQSRREVSVAARVRNVDFQVSLGASAPIIDRLGEIAPTGDLEHDALTITRALLTRLHAPARPAHPVAYRAGEVRKVHDVCRDLPSGADRIPGAKPSGTASSAKDGLTASCAWRHGDDTLTVSVEAVAPGADGKDATGTASDATGGWSAEHDFTKVPGLGDQAVVRTYDEDVLRDVDLWVRRGNLVVAVSYERWHGGPTAAAMREDAKKIVRTVLGAYR